MKKIKNANFAGWLKTSLGKSILECEKKALIPALSSIYGENLLLIGEQNQETLISNHRFRKVIQIAPENIEKLYALMKEKPGEANIVDAIVMPHAFELINHPQILFQQIQHILKPNGHLIIIGFNPIGLFGLRQLFSLRHHAPWSGHFYSIFRITDWLTLLGLEITSVQYDFYHFPFYTPNWLKKLSLLKLFGKIVPVFFSGIYIITARKNIVGITPEKTKWKFLAHLFPRHEAKPATRGLHREP